MTRWGKPERAARTATGMPANPGGPRYCSELHLAGWRRAGLLRSVWSAALEGRDRTDFGSRCCQIHATNSPHIRRDSKKRTAWSLSLPAPKIFSRARLRRRSQDSRHRRSGNYQLSHAVSSPLPGIITYWRACWLSHACGADFVGKVSPGQFRPRRPRLRGGSIAT
jgi:hypothetical protein